METSKLKNMVVLKSVPSNIIEEAIIVLKKNIKVKELEIQNQINQDKTKKELPNKSSNKENYIIKEAEMIINQYISKVENNKRKEVQNKKQKRKYNTLKKWLYITSLISATEFLILLIR